MTIYGENNYFDDRVISNDVEQEWKETTGLWWNKEQQIYFEEVINDKKNSTSYIHWITQCKIK
jgi:hypothetical protein